jgi:hypothetical protein
VTITINLHKISHLASYYGKIRGMKKAPETLPTDVTLLQELVVALRAQNDDLVAKNQQLSEMFRLACAAKTLW